MFIKRKTLLCALILVLCSPLFAQTKVIFDTDMGSDCDDAGAMAILHKLADKGEIEILGVIFSSSKNKYGVGVCDAINTYYGRGDLPLGQNFHGDVGDPKDWYCKEIATDVKTYHHDIVDTATDMVTAYKEMLKKEKDGSVTILTVGHPIGLVHLLRDKEGPSLIKRKVSRLVAMGGGGWNFCQNGMAQYLPELLEKWPCEIYLSPAGKDIITGNKKLPKTPKNNPVRQAYESWMENCLKKGRPSWDLIATLFVARPELFEIDSFGSLEQPDGKDVVWIKSKNNPKHFKVTPKKPAKIQALMEEMMSEPPDCNIAKPSSSRQKDKNPKKKIPVIFDTDIGDDIDDTWALALLLQCPELDIKLITTELAAVEPRVKIVAKMLEIAGRTEIPIGMGVPYGKRGYNQEFWIKDYDLSSYPGTIHKDGVQALIDTIMNSSETITVIAVGPLPTIAEALRREPRIVEKARFIGMHGSVRIGYDGKAQVANEYNIIAALDAAKKVFTAGWDMTITPLDTCGIVKLDGEKYQKVLKSDSPLCKAIMQNYRGGWMDNQTWLKKKDWDVDKTSTVLFDTVAIYLAISTDLVEMEKLGIRITDKGQTVIYDKAKKINCATGWKDLDGFEDFLVERLTK